MYTNFNKISDKGVARPICAVSGAKFLTQSGWIDLRNPVEIDVPFRLYRDEGRTFLQWEGEPALRNRMNGRLVLVYLKCRDLITDVYPESGSEAEFSPCVAFRVVGTPLKYPNNVSEVVFSADAQSSDASDGNGLSVSEIVAIGICSVLLGLIYVASVFLYLHIRRRRKDGEVKREMRDNASLSNVEEGVVKNNPLLGLGRHFSPADVNSFSDTTESDTDVTPDILQHQDDRKKNIQLTSALVHPYRHEIYAPLTSIDSFHHQDSSAIERLPEENVSIIETPDGREERPENVRAIGTTRKKLYFNPAYFEPHLLQTPPPAAIEFLTKIREVITIAKQKMVSKRFSPSLLGIPEEDTNYSLESTNYSQSFNSRRGSIISLKRENSRRRICSGCPDCEPKDLKSLYGRLPGFPSAVACETCSNTTESKQHSIRKWLEDIPVIKPSNKEDEGQSEIQNLSSISSPKRMRSPARSLPPNHISPPIRALSPKAASDRVETRKSGDQTNSSFARRTRKPIVKPNCPPPPLPKNLPENHYDSIPSIRPKQKSLPPPDMIHEAMAVEEETRIPTITKKKMNAVIDEFSRNLTESTSTKPPVDYEADSLERSTKNKGFSTPTEYAEVSSSQPSPSLSAALPMDEEMTMGNAIINAKTGNMTISKLNMNMLQPESHEYELIVLKQGDGSYSLPELLQRGNLVSEVYVNNGYNYSSAPSSISSNSSTLENKTPKVRYDNNKPGHLMIEVEDCPDNYIRVEDSDEFEPDTLDRKPKLTLNNEAINIESDAYTDSLERPSHILLKSSGSFKNRSSQTNNFNRKFGSLREIYEAKNRKAIQDRFNNSNDLKWREGIIDDCEGKLLTLEERHSKRQRRSTTPNINDVPPDVIPPNNHEVAPIYAHPKPPRKVIDSKPPLPPRCLSKKPKEVNHAYDQQRDSSSIASSNSSEYEAVIRDPKLNTNHNVEKCDASILRNFIQSDDIFFKNGINNQFILQAQTVTSIPNLNRTIFKGSFDHNAKVASILGKYLQKPEDSGYLSTDSDDSKKRKCSKDQTQCGSSSTGPGSETDESLCDGHSESGAESIETHSVFFDSFRKPCLTVSLDSGLDSDLKMNSFTNIYTDDYASSDSENVSFKTVVNNRRH
ncbi:hypothetical protein Trydic_g9367 [Trypoxylus dichotomus]